MGHAELTLGQESALRAIVEAPLAWTTLARLKRLGHGRAVEELLTLGLVVTWERDALSRRLVRGPFITLSPLAEERLGVEIFEEGPDEHPRWIEPGDVPTQVLPGSSRPRPFVVSSESNPRLRLPEMVRDRSAGPVDQAIANEEFLMVESRTDDGRLDVDPQSGRVKREPVVIFGRKVPIDRRLCG